MGKERSKKKAPPKGAIVPTELRKRLHETFDAWIDANVPAVLDLDDPPSLRALSAHVFDTRASLISEVLAELVREVVSKFAELRRTPCPGCTKVLWRKRTEAKKISTLHGTFVLERPYFYCAACKQGYSPVDEALELAGELHQLDVQEAVARLATKMPYEEAVATFGQLTGVKVREHCAHDTVQRLEEATTPHNVLPSAEEIEKRIDAVQGQGKRRPVMVVTADGAMTPVRPRGGRNKKRGPGIWREVKGFRIYLVDKDRRIVSLASWHQISDGAELGEVLKAAAARIPTDRVRIALLGDGASWLWTAMSEAFPSGRQVLDYFHCAEHLWNVANLQHHEDPQRARIWVEATMSALYEDSLDDALSNLRAMLPRTHDTAKEINKLVDYLSGHAERLNYRGCKRSGMPIGSGAIESANKAIVHTRMKRPGAWWLVENNNTMLRLRCALFNGTFSSVFNTYAASTRRQAA